MGDAHHYAVLAFQANAEPEPATPEGPTRNHAKLAARIP